jgi:predicted metalloprotease
MLVVPEGGYAWLKYTRNREEKELNERPYRHSHTTQHIATIKLDIPLSGLAVVLLKKRVVRGGGNDALRLDRSGLTRKPDASVFAILKDHGADPCPASIS